MSNQRTASLRSEKLNSSTCLCCATCLVRIESFTKTFFIFQEVIGTRSLKCWTNYMTSLFCSAFQLLVKTYRIDRERTPTIRPKILNLQQIRSTAIKGSRKVFFQGKILQIQKRFWWTRQPTVTQTFYFLALWHNWHLVLDVDVATTNKAKWK